MLSSSQDSSFTFQYPTPWNRRRTTRNGRGRSGSRLHGLPGAVDGLTDDVFDVLHVYAERLADVHRPDLGAEVRLEVELSANVRTRRLPVLTHHHEGRQEDGLET